MLKAVLDTNAVLSAHLNNEGPSLSIFSVLRFEPFARRVCRSLEKASLWPQPARIAGSLRLMREAAILVAPRKRLDVTRDPDDNKVLECALEARADYVVTGNARDFPARFQDIRIISPRRFLTLLASAPTDGPPTAKISL
jgi:uncharacterized protein